MILARQRPFRQLIVFDIRLLDKFLRGFGIRQGTQAPKPLTGIVPYPSPQSKIPRSDIETLGCIKVQLLIWVI